MGGWGWRPRPRHYGGGCLGGLVSAALTPIILLLFIVAMLLSFCSAPDNRTPEYETSYNEEVFEDYADDQYAALFSGSKCYEDNLLIVFLVNEDYYQYNYIAWVGDDIAKSISDKLGNNSTELGQTMESCINETNYKYSLDSDLAAVMDAMTAEIQGLGLESSLTCGTNHGTVQTTFVNKTDLPMTASTVENALERFAGATGIPVAIVVEDMEDVFGSGSSAQTTQSSSRISVWMVLVLVAAVVLVVFFIVKSRKGRDGEFGTSEKNSKYRQFDDQY